MFKVDNVLQLKLLWWKPSVKDMTLARKPLHPMACLLSQKSFREEFERNTDLSQLSESSILLYMQMVVLCFCCLDLQDMFTDIANAAGFTCLYILFRILIQECVRGSSTSLRWKDVAENVSPFS